MCDFEKGFILCTCAPEAKPIVHNQNSRRHKKKQADQPQEYRWFLAEFVETYEALMEGIYQFPRSDIGQGLTAEWVLLHLNYEKCFDFDYTPQEGDNLVINQPNNPSFYLSFIFQDGIWIEDHYSHFSTLLKLKQVGTVQKIEQNN
jgi:hypothetical protein